MVIKRSMRSNTKAAKILGQQVGPPPPGSEEPPLCPLCDRPMINGPTVDEHHLVPRSKGGKEKFLVHKICHQKIHQVFSEKELARQFHTWEALQDHTEMAAFISWVKKRPPEFL